ncbi:MAG: FAD-dependent oxidoreductase [Sulfurimonas sp.]|nr:FAD-dependent oxidoreductase [Sulfurimonas sp.]
MYDTAIIGAGINGVSVAYELMQKGQRVILFDMNGIASGGSGAAGAFISPKFSKGGELKEIIDKAFVYSMKFYEENFPHIFTKVNLIHTAQDDSEEFTIDAGLVNASAMCHALAKGVKLIASDVKSLVYDDTSWNINETYTAKNVVLATGAYAPVIHKPYIQMRGIWGHRIDVKTSTQNKNALHKFVSISPSKDGVLSIGATHNVHYHPQSSTEPYDVDAGRKELLDKASKSINLENVEVIKDYTGLRSGSLDYMPLVGSLVMSKVTLASTHINFKVKKADYEAYDYYPNLYMINGSGGYGFVLAPYLAKILVEHILSAKKISDRISPARFFHRYAKKL